MNMRKIKKIFLLLVMLIVVRPLTADAHETEMIQLDIEGTYNYEESFELLTLINAKRAEVGLQTVVMDEALISSAKQRAAECAVFFSHYRPKGGFCNTILAENGITCNETAENISWALMGPKYVMSQWNTPGIYIDHILNPNFTRVGVACFRHETLTYYVVIFSDGEVSSIASLRENTDEKVTVQSLTDNVERVGVMCNLQLYVGDTGEATLHICNASMLRNPMLDGPVDGTTSFWHSTPVGDEVVYKSSDTSVITVDADGTLHAVGAGTAKITAYLADDESVSDTEQIIVYRHTPVMQFASAQVIKKYGDSVFQNPLQYIGDGIVTYSSSNPEIASVDSVTGVVTIKKVGEVTITATGEVGTAYEAATDSYRLVIGKADTVIETETMYRLTNTSEGFSLNAASGDESSRISYVSSDNKVVSVSDDGYVTVNGIGTAFITVTSPATEQHKKATKTITVKVIQAEKNTIFSHKNLCYRVTSPANTVAVVGLTARNQKNLTIPSTVTVGGVSYKVTEVGDAAFEGNNQLKKLKIGSNITKIGKNAFAKCKELVEVNISSKRLKKIGKNAFCECEKLKKIILKTKKLTNSSVGKDAFKQVKNCTFKVPEKQIKAYKALFTKKGAKSKIVVKKL